MPYMVAYVLKFKITYLNGPRCFPNFSAVRTINLPITCTQMKGITYFVSRPWKSHSPPYSNEVPEVQGWLDYKAPFLFGFNNPSRLFHSFWAEPIARWGENGRSPIETTWPPASRTWLVSHVTRARLDPQLWDDERFGALKISGLNHSATGAANENCAEHNEVVTHTYNWFISKIDILNHDFELLRPFENISALFQTNKFWIWDPLKARQSPMIWMKIQDLVLLSLWFSLLALFLFDSQFYNNV